MTNAQASAARAAQAASSFFLSFLSRRGPVIKGLSFLVSADRMAFYLELAPGN